MTSEEAFRKKYSNISLTTKGKVVKILEDEHFGSPHQRFIIEPHLHHTILIVNNIERSYLIPIKIGDLVEVHGTYVWNKYGGLLHETHHHEEPGHHEDGFINLVETSS